jgi:hypothetical protein
MSTRTPLAVSLALCASLLLGACTAPAAPKPDDTPSAMEKKDDKQPAKKDDKKEGEEKKDGKEDKKDAPKVGAALMQLAGKKAAKKQKAPKDNAGGGGGTQKKVTDWEGCAFKPVVTCNRGHFPPPSWACKTGEVCVQQWNQRITGGPTTWYTCARAGDPQFSHCVDWTNGDRPLN